MIQTIENIINNGLLKDKWEETVTSFKSLDVIYNDTVHGLLKGLLAELKLRPSDCVVRVDEGDELIAVDQAFKPSWSGEKVSITITKNGDLFFLTPKGFLDHLYRAQALETGTIRLYFIQEEFKTGDAYYVPWNSNKKDVRVKFDKIKDPAFFVRCIGKESVDFLPKAPQNWITSDVGSADKCESWVLPASLKLLSLVCGDLQVDGQMYTFIFKGDRARELKLNWSTPGDRASLLALFTKLNEIVGWVYSEEKHITTKLTLLHQSLTFGLLDETTQYEAVDLRRIFSSAFDGARLSFDYFMKNISKDVVKNMSDLTKTLLDNQSKIKQNISDLSSSMWKDFTTVFGVLVLQFAIKQNDVVAKYFPIFGYGLCIYVAISYAITSYSGFTFYRDTRTSMTETWPRVYSYISSTDMQLNFLEPLKKSFIRFRRIFWIVAVAYGGLILFVLLLIPKVQQMLREMAHGL